jgi:hypothetical protein
MKRTELKRITPLRTNTSPKPSTKRMKSSRPKMTPARANARGQACTLRLPGCYPGPENEQVQLCHLRMNGAAGGGQKPHDSEAVFACTHCHDLLDGRKHLIPELRSQFHSGVILRALQLTLRAQREAGVLIYRGEA